jgi:hypothetical protein
MMSLSQHLLFAAGVLAASALFALLEIQIEGGEGWAGRLPTWRYESRWTRRILGARKVTGYHVYFQLFVLVMAHLAYLVGAATPTWGVELRLLSFLILFWVIEDFLWFVFNPAYGLRRFRREAIWWHADTWWGFMPRDYWIFLPIAVALYVLSWSAG